MSDKPNSSMTGRHWWCQTNRRNRFSRKTGWHRPCLTNMKINSPWWHWCQTDNGHSWVCRSSTLVVSTLEIDTVKTRQAYSVISHCSIKIQLFKHLQWLRYYRASCRLETLVVGVGYNYGWYVKSHGSFLFRAVGSPGSIFVPFLFVSDKNWGAGQNTLLGERSRASESVVESVRFILGSGSQESAFFVSGVRLWYCWTRKSLKKKNLKGRQNDDDTFSWEKKIFPAIFPLSDFFTPISPANVVSYGLRSVEQKKLKPT